ncbi:hypothetical protein [Boudabousia tangfeifanii]|nr:hypothetical protein [Boudabousia tangfeifanii]
MEFDGSPLDKATGQRIGAKDLQLGFDTASTLREKHARAGSPPDLVRRLHLEAANPHLQGNDPLGARLHHKRVDVVALRPQQAEGGKGPSEQVASERALWLCELKNYSSVELEGRPNVHPNAKHLERANILQKFSSTFHAVCVANTLKDPQVAARGQQLRDAFLEADRLGFALVFCTDNKQQLAFASAFEQYFRMITRRARRIQQQTAEGGGDLSDDLARVARSWDEDAAARLNFLHWMRYVPTSTKISVRVFPVLLAEGGTSFKSLRKLPDGIDFEPG